MPIRGLIYLAKLYKAFIDERNLNIHGSKLIMLPKPQYIIFYNGMPEHKDVEETHLSDAFGGDGSCLELVATMYNINYGHNKELMGKCKILWEYSYFVSRVRYYREKGYSIEKAVDTACVECISKGILREFLIKDRSEVLDMFLVDYKPSLQRKFDREEGYQDGMADGLKAGESIGYSKGESDGYSRGESMKLIAQTRKKMLKGKTLPETSEDLDEPIETIAPFYDLIKTHPEKNDAEIYELSLKR